ncbi:MAG: low molecular weight protein-tyrosine-phosphatase [Mariprofundaceae bacterium]|nr:low molecular weight protein-tyrosine-phosphatase [Mariprofundaceae bacterium]
MSLTADSNTSPLRVLFVCLGNICRSPLAEVVVKEAAQQRGIAELFHFESAGTGSWHIGLGADQRSAAKALQHGLNLNQHAAQQITHDNISDWDILVAMDADNRQNLLAMGAKDEQILMMRMFEQQGAAADVPDPYYGAHDGFEDVYQMLRLNADALLVHLQDSRS